MYNIYKQVETRFEIKCFAYSTISKKIKLSDACLFIYLVPSILPNPSREIRMELSNPSLSVLFLFWVLDLKKYYSCNIFKFVNIDLHMTKIINVNTKLASGKNIKHFYVQLLVTYDFNIQI